MRERNGGSVARETGGGDDGRGRGGGEGWLGWEKKWWVGGKKDGWKARF